MVSTQRTEDGARGDSGAVLRPAETSASGRTSQGGDGPSKMGPPIDPRLVKRAAATRWYLVGGVLVGAATALLTLWQAWAIATGVSAVFAAAPGFEYTTPVPGTGDWPPLASTVVVLAIAFTGKAALAWLNSFLAQRASAAVKSQLRRDIMRARLDRPVDPTISTASLISLMTQGLDALDGFYSKYLPQLMLAVTVPVIVGVAVLTSDLLSAVIVALTLPLIPVFMALVGWATEARTRRRWALQTRLARHFADLVAGLPTLQVFGRARAQAEGLRRSEDAHRAETMVTLRISFLSALVLELLATLSVAVIAVTIGFRVVRGELDLQTALFVLVLAPEVYLPVRQVGVHYHDAADGIAAAESAFAMIDGAAVVERESLVERSPQGEVVAGGRHDQTTAPLVASASAPTPDAVPARDGLSSMDGASLHPSAEAVPMPVRTPNGVRGDRFDVASVHARGEGASSVERSEAESWLAGGTTKPAGVTTKSVQPAREGFDSGASRLRSTDGTTSTPRLRSTDGTTSTPHLSSTGEAPLVSLTDFSLTYPGSTTPAVAGVTLTVRPGEFVALIGPSGGGKTTVLNALMGFLAPTSGTCATPPRASIAYVGQNPGMIRETVADNLRLGDPEASDARLRAALDRAGAPELALDHPVGDDGEGLSSGERRRVATARALLRIERGASLLLLDEPTAGLDADAEATLLRSLRDLGVAVVVVTHRRAVIAEADRVVEVGR